MLVLAASPLARLEPQGRVLQVQPRALALLALVRMHLKVLALRVYRSPLLNQVQPEAYPGTRLGRRYFAGPHAPVNQVRMHLKVLARQYRLVPVSS